MTTSTPYGDAFKSAKASIEQNDLELREGQTAERERLNAEAEADIQALESVVIPELDAANKQLKSEGGELSWGGAVTADGKSRPVSITFRITDRGDWGRSSLFYEIRPLQGSVAVNRSNSNDPLAKGRKVESIGERLAILRRSDLTAESVRKIVIEAISDYSNAKPGHLIRR